MYYKFCILHPGLLIHYNISWNWYSVSLLQKPFPLFFVSYYVPGMLYLYISLTCILHSISFILYSESFILYPISCILYPIFFHKSFSQNFYHNFCILYINFHIIYIFLVSFILPPISCILYPLPTKLYHISNIMYPLIFILRSISSILF